MNKNTNQDTIYLASSQNTMKTEIAVAPEPAPKPSRKLFNTAGLGVLLILITKGKGILFGLLKVKGVATVLTMVFNILAYWWYGKLGLPAAVGFVMLLLVHELGHVIALNRYGIPATAPVFIPFVGAVVGMKQMPKNAWEEAIVAIAGPILGSIGAVFCLAVFFATGSKLWLWLFATGVLLNLFNLIPCSPLDGGRIVGAVWRGFWVVGIAGLIWLSAIQQDLFLLTIAVICLPDVGSKVVRSKVGMQFIWAFMTVACICASIIWQKWFGIFPSLVCLEYLWLTTSHWDTFIGLSEPVEYCQLPMKQRVVMGGLYTSLVAVLSFGLYWVNSIGALKIPH